MEVKIICLVLSQDSLSGAQCSFHQESWLRHASAQLGIDFGLEINRDVIIWWKIELGVPLFFYLKKKYIY